MHIKKHSIQLLCVGVLWGMNPMAAHATCPASCRPFNVQMGDLKGEKIFQVEYYDCTPTKNKKYEYIAAEPSTRKKVKRSGEYCAAPNTEVRVELWISGDTNSQNVWPARPVGDGWNVTCLDNGGNPSCSGSPVNTKNCKTFTVTFASDSGIHSQKAVLQPEYTECVTKQYMKPQLGKGNTATYYVEPNTAVRVEQSYSTGTVNKWKAANVGDGTTVTCTESVIGVTCK